MILSPAIRESYPDLSAWIALNIPKVRQNAKVFKAFQKYARFDEKVAVRALVLDNPPIIERRFLGSDNGEFLTKYPDTVFLAVSICKRFHDYMDDKRMTVLVESTILHEMVHWGNYVANYVPTDGEHGKAFEVEAYGHDVKSFWP